MNEISLKGTIYDFLTDYGLIVIEHVVNIHKNLMKKAQSYS